MIIWTLTELAEWANASRELRFVKQPIAFIEVPPETRCIEPEVSQVRGKLLSVVVSFPPGCMGLVWVTVFHIYNNGRVETLMLTPRLGDNTHYPALVAGNIEVGDEIRVILDNTDTCYPHTIGVRVEVDTQEAEK